MKAAVIGCLGLAVLAAVVIGVAVLGSYNRLVGLEEGVDAAWGQVENVYQRRADLVPNLVATVQGAADFEQETLDQVVTARSRVGQVQLNGTPDAAQLEAFQSAQGALTSAIGRLLLVVERYPELKATDAYRDLLAQLEGTENRIAVERMRFNEAARDFNTARRRFPGNLVAALFGFDEAKPYFAADDGAAEVPKVSFE
jgi:LemA protein